MEIFENIGKKYWWLNEESRSILNRGYLLRGEEPEDAIDRITTSLSNQFPEQLDRPYIKSIFKEMIEKGWMSLSSPIWANCGTKRGLPISCGGVYISDSMKSIANKLNEVMMQTKFGAGTSGYFGKLRGRGTPITNNGFSSGAVSFMELFNTTMNVVSQGSTRRGSFAAYLDIDHPDIEEFLTIKDIGSPIQNLFYGVCVPDWWMKTMINEEGTYDPETVKQYRKIWSKVLESRQFKGLPYIFFTDNVNKNKPEIYKKLDKHISHSNLCNEIMLADSEEESFVCCLSSMNLELYDGWKDLKDPKYGRSIVQWAIWLLDAVMSEYIGKLEVELEEDPNSSMKNSYNFAKTQRAIGIGTLGLHSYYQKIGRSFDDMYNIGLNKQIFSYIREEAEKANDELCELLGCAPIFEGIEDIKKKRCTTLMAIAPTTSSSAILGQVSPGIEPYSSNYYKVNLAKGNFIRKNKYLEALLNEKLDQGIIDTKEDLEEIWQGIMLNQGSVQHLPDSILNPEEKSIFKTFKEINQHSIILQAAERQKYIDQSQSLNINIPPTTSPKEVNKLIIEAWKMGVKTLYYQRSQSVSKELLSNITNCINCEG